MKRAPLILLTGATGYVGGRLLRRLEASGRRVRCLVRDPQRLAHRVGHETEVAAGDVLNPDARAAALRDVSAAYYLIHSMGARRGFESLDRRAAEGFAQAAAQAGVERIIYLGGVGTGGQGLSSHLRSRQEVGRILRNGPVPAIEFQSSIVLGSGSLSFEMIRALVERLPVMVTPRWVSTPAQPIAIEDLLAYLEAALDLPLPESRVFRIGGAERTSYGGIMQEYARQRGLRRWMVPVPVLTPHLSSLWLGLVTPLYARIGRKLVDSLRHPTVVDDDEALQAFAIRPRGLQASIARAIEEEERVLAETRWSDALSSSGLPRDWTGVRFGTRIVSSYTTHVPVPAARAFAPIRRIGGRRGWYHANGLWRLRGALDLLVGGVGLRRGRRDPERLAVGDTVDWWRVEQIEPERRLRLVAEMRLPGRAWLEFEVTPAAGGSRIRQSAIFDPVGLAGLLYWYALYPLHFLVFRGMLRAIARQATRPQA